MKLAIVCIEADGKVIVAIEATEDDKQVLNLGEEVQDEMLQELLEKVVERVKTKWKI